MKKASSIEKIKEKIHPVLRRYDVVRAGVFGSFARGDNGKTSDIDIVVEFKGKKSLLDLSGLKIALEKILNREVDVLTYNSLHHLIKERILEEQIAIL